MVNKFNYDHKQNYNYHEMLKKLEINKKYNYFDINKNNAKDNMKE
jgi:hypothetical protein